MSAPRPRALGARPSGPSLRRRQAVRLLLAFVVLDLLVGNPGVALRGPWTTHDLADLHAYPADQTTYESTAAVAVQTREVLEALFDSSGAQVLVSLGVIHSSLYATACYPVITVPLGLRRTGMPVGVTLVARAGQDADLLSWACAFEQATHLRREPGTVR